MRANVSPNSVPHPTCLPPRTKLTIRSEPWRQRARAGQRSLTSESSSPGCCIGYSAQSGPRPPNLQAFRRCQPRPHLAHHRMSDSNHSLAAEHVLRQFTSGLQPDPLIVGLDEGSEADPQLSHCRDRPLLQMPSWLPEDAMNQGHLLRSASELTAIPCHPASAQDGSQARSVPSFADRHM